TVTVEYFTFEDMQTKYVAAIENKNTPDVGQLETSAPARFAGMGQLLDLSGFAKQVESQVGKPPANVAPVTIVDGKTWAIPWYIMAPFWYVCLDGLGQQRELHRAQHRADLQRAEHHLRDGKRRRQGHRRRGPQEEGGGARQPPGPAASGRTRGAPHVGDRDELQHLQEQQGPG